MMTHAAVPATSIDLAARLNRRVTNYNLGVFNLVDALIRVSNDFQIPMGIVWVNTPAARTELPRAWKDATVREIIEDIAKTQPDYQVQVKHGVVHISQATLIADRENFLKQKIPAFELHDTLVEVASFKLHTLITSQRYGQISIAGPGDSKVDLKLKNPTVEAILDALVLASNRKIWIVTFSDDTRLMPSGLRRTRSLFTDMPMSDAEQPIWHLQRWGDPLPRVVAPSNRQ